MLISYPIILGRFTLSTALDYSPPHFIFLIQPWRHDMIPDTSAGMIPVRTPTLINFSDRGRNWLIRNEGSRTKTINGKLVHTLYDDSQGYATIGYGHLVSKRSVKHQADDAAQKPYINGLSEEEASRLFSQDLAFHIEGIRKNIKVKITQAQFDTLVDISFNTGRSALMQSQIVKLINQGKLTEAAVAIKTFRIGGNNAGRRRRESDNFLRGSYQ